MEQEFNIPVISIVGLNDVIVYLKTETQGQAQLIAQIQAYRQEYGVE